MRKIVFEIEKETPGTYRFKEAPAEGQPPVIGTLYIQKWALPKPAPKKLTITLETSWCLL